MVFIKLHKHKTLLRDFIFDKTESRNQLVRSLAMVKFNCRFNLNGDIRDATIWAEKNLLRVLTEECNVAEHFTVSIRFVKLGLALQ